MAWHGADGRQIYYEDTGRGDTVVFHAWLGWQHHRSRSLAP